MGINVACCADVTVTEPLLNLLQAHAIGIEQTGTTMAQIVKADTLHLVCYQKIWEMLAQEIGPNPLSHRGYIQLRQKICKTEKRPYQHLCWHGRKSFKACFTPLFLSLYQKRGGDFVVFDRLKKAPALLAPEPSLSLTSLVQRKF